MKTITEIADAIELQTWAKESPTTSSSIKEELEAALSDTSEQDPEELAQNVMDEFASRQQLLGDAYPFACDGYKLRLSHAEPHNTTYLFCLALSLFPADAIENDQRCIQFETIVRNAAVQFFGGEGLRIGAPWATAEITGYDLLLDKVIDMIPNLGQKLKRAAQGGGDAGWDVLVVKNFKDNLFPRFVALGNCATGKYDWKRKGMETQPTLFWSYFEHEHRSVFITFFAVPFAMDQDARLRKLSGTNLTFDRFRLCEFAPISVEEAGRWLVSQRDQALAVSIL
jgi:hypothetical protein